jgi:hypothetical protein
VLSSPDEDAKLSADTPPAEQLFVATTLVDRLIARVQIVYGERQLPIPTLLADEFKPQGLEYRLRPLFSDLAEAKLLLSRKPSAAERAAIAARVEVRKAQRAAALAKKKKGKSAAPARSGAGAGVGVSVASGAGGGAAGAIVCGGCGAGAGWCRRGRGRRPCVCVCGRERERGRGCGPRERLRW